MEPLLRRFALGDVQELIGFWALWQLEGGSAGLERLGMPKSTIYRKVNLSRESFGVHPDVFAFPGLTADPETYLKSFGRLPVWTLPTCPRSSPTVAPAPRNCLANETRGHYFILKFGNHC